MLRLTGNTFKVLRVQAGLNVQQTADILGVSKQYISMVNTSTRTLSEEKTAQFLESIGVTAKEAYYLHRSLNG